VQCGVGGSPFIDLLAFALQWAPADLVPRA